MPVFRQENDIDTSCTHFYYRLELLPLCLAVFPGQLADRGAAFARAAVGIHASVDIDVL